MADPEIIIVLGRRGFGKSTWTKQYVRGVSRLAVWDPKRSYAVDWPSDLSEWFEQNEETPRYRIGGFYDQDQEIIGSIAYAKKDTCLVLEECAFVFNPRQDFPEWARECVYLGRERGVSVVAVAQRPKSVHIALRSQATRVICFNQHELSDAEWITENFEFSDFDQIKTLSRLECFDISAEGTNRYTVQLPHDKQPQETLEQPPEPSQVPFPSGSSDSPDSDNSENP